MNQFVTSDWIISEAMKSLQRSAAARGTLLSGFNRPWPDIPDANLPTFDYIPTETGREAAKRLWHAAFGDKGPT